MTLQLDQRQFFTRRRFLLDGADIVCSLKSPLQDHQIHIALEDLLIHSEDRTIRIKTFLIGMLAFGLFLIVVLIAAFTKDPPEPAVWLIYPPGLLLSTVAFFFLCRRYRYFFLRNGGRLILFWDRRNQPRAREFVEALYASRNRLLRDRYLRIDSNNTLTAELEKLQWLHGQHVIDDAELESCVERVRQYWATGRPAEDISLN